MGRMKRIGTTLIATGIAAVGLSIAVPRSATAASACDSGISRHLDTSYPKWATDVHTAKLCVDLSSVVCEDRAEGRFQAKWTVTSTTDEDDETTTLAGAPFDGARLRGLSDSLSKVTHHTGPSATVSASFDWNDGDSDGGYVQVRLRVTVENPCEPPETTTTQAPTTTQPVTTTQASTTSEPTATTEPTTSSSTTTTQATTTTAPAVTLPPEPHVTHPDVVPNSAQPDSTTNTPTTVRTTAAKGTLPATGPAGKRGMAGSGLALLAAGGAMVLTARRRPGGHPEANPLRERSPLS